MSASLPPIAVLLPHRPPAILLDCLSEISGEGCVARFQVRSGAGYLDAEGVMPAWFGLEMMAQAVAAFSGHRNTLSGRPIRVGYLLGTRSFTSAVPAFKVGTDLEIEVSVIFLDDDGPSAFRCELRSSGEIVARATLKAIEMP